MSAAAEDELPVVISVREEPPPGCTVLPFLFHSGGTACRGRIFLPAGTDGGAGDVDSIVILAHGFCMLQTFEPINTLVRAFVDAKLACATFDYRGFGESDVPVGSPRQLLDPVMLLADWRAAVGAVGTHPRLSSKAAIGLWGTSFSGGHVVATAADHGPDSTGQGVGDGVEVKAVVSWVGCMDYDASMHPSCISKPRFLLEYARASFLEPGRLLKLFGDPGEVCICDGPEERREILALTKSKPLDVPWENGSPPASFLRCRGYKPGLRAAEVACPSLFVSCGADVVTPPQLIEAASVAAGAKAELFAVPAPATHSDPYFPPLLGTVVDRTVAFFLQHLH